MEGGALYMTMDGVDQAKFRVPRNASQSKDLAGRPRPRLHCAGAIVGGPGVPEPTDLVVADGGVADHLRQHTATLLPDDCARENTARKGQYEQPDGSATQMSHLCALASKIARLEI